MALKIIYGTVNSGKTEQCFEYIKNVLDTTNEKVIYIVPDQYSLEAEKNISKRFSKIALDRIEVMNPDRLAKRTFSSVGPIMCDFLDDNAKLMIIEKAIIKVCGKLTYFIKNTQFDGFSSVVLDLIKQFKINCIDSKTLKQIAENSADVNLKYKLYDLSIIYNEYENFFDFPYADADNNMTLLAEKIYEHNLFSDVHFIFDNFSTFSKQQLTVISALIKNAVNVIFSITTDSLLPENKFDLFYKTQKTVQQLYSIACENNVEVLPNTYMDSSYFNNKELEFLCLNYFSNKKNKYTENTKSVFLCRSNDYNGEVEQVAHEISRLVRTENYRYRDFAVVYRNANTYNSIIKNCFDRYGIFYNITEPKYSKGNFIYNALTSVFQILITKYSFEAVFDFVFSCLCNIEEKNKYLLENYVLEVGNREQLWIIDKPITFKGSFSDAEFKIITESITYVRNCLNSFAANFNGRKTVAEIIDAYNDFLEYTNAENTIKKIVNNFIEKGEKEEAQEVVSVYNHVITSMNQMREYFGDTSITFEKFIKIFNSSLSNVQIDVLPSGIDDVMITSIDRFQASKAKVVFVLGTIDGVIPCGYINEGLLKSEELKELGIEEDIVQKHCDENYVIYRLFSSATDKLYVSYPMADNEGKALSPSGIIRNLKEIFPEITEIQNIYDRINILEEVEGIIPTFNKIIKNKDNSFWNVVLKWYKDNKPELYNVIKNAKEYTNLSPKLRNDIIKKLYGEEIKSSISRIEKYNQCQYAYFIRYGLNIDVRKECKLKPNDYGTYMHEIIEKFSEFASSEGWENITHELCSQKASEITKLVLDEYLSDLYKESKRHQYLFNKIVFTMDTVLWNITCFYQQSGYVSIGQEISFGDDGDLAPILINLSNGTEVKLRGKIDRADIRRTENGDFVSIVDYKSSSKDIDFGKILCGIQIQLPIYLDAVCKGFAKEGENILPAAMLYYHINDPIINGNPTMADTDIEEQIKNELKMKGVIYESENIPSVFVAKKTLTMNQINKVCKTAYNQLKNALEKMVEGNIEINPVANGTKTACDYCPYKNICNFDPNFKNNKYREYTTVKMEEFFDYVDEMDN